MTKPKVSALQILRTLEASESTTRLSRRQRVSLHLRAQKDAHAAIGEALPAYLDHLTQTLQPATAKIYE